MKVILLGAASVALFVDAAHAQSTAAAPDLGRGGLRAELIGGYDHDGQDEGVVYGVRVGYDFRMAPQVLLGLDGEISDVTTEHDLMFPPTSLAVEDGLDLYLGGRVTLMVSDRIRLHGGLGYTRARHGSFFLAPNGSFGSQEVFHEGYRASAGAQFSISSRVFLGAEYRRSEYEQGFQREQVVGSVGFRF